MTDKLYLSDQYLKSFDAKISKVAENAVAMDRSAFYPGGGGQPCDRGTIEINGAKYKVVEVKKDGDDILHVLDRKVIAKEGDAAKGILDWDYRYACMRYHSALHTIDGVIQRYYSAGMITGNQIYSDRARMDVDMQGLSKEKVAEILDKTNSIAKEGHAITAKMISKADALAIPGLSRTEPGRKLIEGLDSIRVIDIEGLDVQADGGTHVKNTLEIGIMELLNYENKGAKRKRIEIVLK